MRCSTAGTRTSKPPATTPPGVDVVAALSCFVAVAVAKTLLTKLVFVHTPLPVAVSLLSCIVTLLCLVPVFALRLVAFHGLQWSMLRPLSLVWLAAGLDLGCTNIALASLSVAMAQCLKATQPVLTVAMETSSKGGALQHPLTYASLAVIVAGVAVTRAGSSAVDSSSFGIGMMLLAVAASSAKYVWMKESICVFKEELGPLAYLFWMEAGICCLLLPWSLLNGELLALVQTTAAEDWPLVVGSAALGGVRALSQLMMLRVVSATALSVASLAIPAAAILLSFPLFGTEASPALLAGTALMLAGSVAYARGYPTPPPAAAAEAIKPWLGGAALASIGAAGVLFQRTGVPTQHLALAALGLSLLGAKVFFGAKALRRWRAELRRTRAAELARAAAANTQKGHRVNGAAAAPSRMQRFFRVFYLVEQQAGQPARALVWYGLLLELLWLALYSWSNITLSLHALPPLTPLLAAQLASLAALRPLGSTLLLWFTPLAPKPGVGGEPAWANDPDFLSRIGAVIPCHRSEAEIGATVRAILKYLPVANVVVVDNANAEAPPDGTAAAVAAVDAEVQVVFVPRGLKSLALWKGMEALPKHVEYILHVDDDTLLSDAMVFDESWFLADPAVSEVTFPIFTRRVNLLTEIVGLVFKLNSHHSAFNNSTSGTSLWAAGVVGLARREALTSAMRDHPMLPFGEDAFHGLLQLSNGRKIVRDTRCNVVTFAPPVLSTAFARSEREQGYGAASLWKQRAQRWSVTRLRRTGWTLMLLLFYDGGSLWCNVWFRLLNLGQVLASLSLVAVALPLLVAAASAALDAALSAGSLSAAAAAALAAAPWPQLFKLAAGAKAASYVSEVLGAAFCNYVLWRHRPDYRVSTAALLALPLLSDFLNVCEMVGAYLALAYWIPFVPTRVWAFTHHEDDGARAAGAAADAGARWWDKRASGRSKAYARLEDDEEAHGGVANGHGGANGHGANGHARDANGNAHVANGHGGVANGHGGVANDGSHESEGRGSGTLVRLGGLGGLLGGAALFCLLRAPPPVHQHAVLLKDRPLVVDAGPALGALCRFLNKTDNATHALRLPRAAVFAHVLGWPRSGSSMLSAIIDAHPHAAVANEYDVLQRFAVPAAVPAPMPPRVAAFNLTRSDVLEAQASTSCAGSACPSLAELGCEIAQRTTAYRGPRLFRKWNIPGTAQGWASKFESPLQVLGAKKVGRPWRRHAANPAASWAMIGAMNATLPVARWIYLLRDPYSQVSNCLIRHWCAAHNLDYYANKTEWRAAAPLQPSAGAMHECVADFELVALGVADVLQGIPTRGFGSVLAVAYEDLCTAPVPTLSGMCSFLGLACDHAYLGAVAAWVRAPHDDWRYIRWDEAHEMSLSRIQAMVEAQPAVLALRGYAVPRLGEAVQEEVE